MDEQIKQIAERLRGLRDVLELNAEDIACQRTAFEVTERTACVYRCQRHERTPPVAAPVSRHGRSEPLPGTF